MKSDDWSKRPHVDVMSDKEARDQAKASKKKKRSTNPKLGVEETSSASNPSVTGNSKVQNSPVKGSSKIQKSPSKNKTKNQANKSKNSAKFNNLAHKHSTGATNWQKFLAEGAEGGKKKVPTVKNTSVENRQNSGPKNVPAQKQTGPKMTKVVGMDCEMVGVGEDGRDSILARVSIVNVLGDCIYDKCVKPREKVTDYRTFVSGIREEDLVDGEDFEVVQREVAEILRRRILVGHAIKNDLEVLFLTHPRQNIRDTAKFFRKGGGRTPSLKSLASQYLDVTIQEGEHSSIQDAKAAVQLYNLYRKQWELGGGNRNHNRIDTYHNKIRPQELLAEDT